MNVLRVKVADFLRKNYLRINNSRSVVFVDVGRRALRGHQQEMLVKVLRQLTEAANQRPIWEEEVVFGNETAEIIERGTGEHRLQANVQVAVDRAIQQALVHSVKKRHGERQLLSESQRHILVEALLVPGCRELVLHDGLLLRLLARLGPEMLQL